MAKKKEEAVANGLIEQEVPVVAPTRVEQVVEETPVVEEVNPHTIGNATRAFRG